MVDVSDSGSNNKVKEVAGLSISDGAIVIMNRINEGKMKEPSLASCSETSINDGRVSCDVGIAFGSF